MTPSPLPRTSTPDADQHRGLAGAANAFDIVGVTLAFFFIGFALDAWLGTTPWCMVSLTVLGIVGAFLRTWYSYSAEMDRLDAARRAPRSQQPPRSQEPPRSQQVDHPS